MLCAGLISPDAAALDRGETGVVIEVVDGDTLLLDSGLEVRLIGLQAPKLPLGRPGFPTWPLAPEAKAALATLAGGRTVVLAYGGLRRDRYGRALAQVYRADGLWLQGAMIEDGHARVYSFADNRACARGLLALEAQARAERRGIWRLDAYRLRDAESLGADIDTYQIVEAPVLQAADVRGRVFLNFGPDRTTDFTATVAPRDTDLFAAAGIDLLALEGRVVRLRGWLTSWNGPNMELTHPEQVELADPNADFSEAIVSPCADGPID